MSCGTDSNMEESGSANTESVTDGPASPASIVKEQRELELSQSEPLVDASTKARAYLVRKKSELKDRIRAKFADQISTYDAIRAFIGRANMAPDLFGGNAVLAYDLGDFFSNSDGRMALCKLTCDYSVMANISFSFEPDSWKCRCCVDQHKILDRLRDQQSRAATRRVFFLGDQACPPALPGLDSNGCIPVLRQEDASIKDLIQLFIHTVRGFRLQPGSIVVVCSATQMAAAGFTHYLDQLAQARESLNNFTRGEVELVPGPPFLYEGTTSRQLLRTIAELTGWLKDNAGPVSTLASTLQESIRLLKTCTVGPQTPLEPNVYTVPSFTTSGPPEKLWCSGHNCILPTQVGELSQAMEQELVNKLVDELNYKTGMGQAAISINRRPEPTQATEGASGGNLSRILVIGASNAERLGVELESTGAKVVKIKTTNWLPTKDGVVDLVAHVRRAVELDNPDVVIFYMLDNIVYLARDPLGVTSQPKRGADGKYHVKGELVLAQKETQFNIYKAVKPVLAAAGQKPMVIVTPIPRYVSAPCCNEPDHVTNFQDHEFADSLRDKLEEIRTNWRSFLFADNIRRAGVINPTPLLDQSHPEGQWEDPVHPTRPFFTKLADMVISSAERIIGKRRLAESGSEDAATSDIGRHNTGPSYGPNHRGGRGARRMGIEWAGTARGPRGGQEHGYTPPGGNNRISGPSWRGRGRGRGNY